MKMTTDEKISRLSGNPVYLPDHLAERLAVKLSADDIRDLSYEIKRDRQESIQRFCVHIRKIRTQKEQLAAIEQEAKKEINS